MDKNHRSILLFGHTNVNRISLMPFLNDNDIIYLETRGARGKKDTGDVPTCAVLLRVLGKVTMVGGNIPMVDEGCASKHVAL